MAEGNLGADGTATVTLDDRVAQVIVSAAGGELWVTTDGSNPDHPKAGTVRVIPQRSPQAIPVSSLADPTVVKLRSPNGAGYTVTVGPLTDADSAEGMGAPSSGATDVEVAAAIAAHVIDEHSGATDAADVTFTPAGGLAATDVEAALAELDAEKATALVAGNRQTASYIFALADLGKEVEMNVADANTLTIPPNTDVAFPVGAVLAGTQWGAGQTTITPGAGVTLRSSGGKLLTSAQYACFTARQVAADEWLVSGDLAT